MKIKTSELTGPALDWAVACIVYPDDADLRDPESGCMSDHEDYSTDWAHGGPIIEREKIGVHTNHEYWVAIRMWYDDEDCCCEVSESGPTPLIAAMRCYVASRLGDEIEIPEALT